MKTGSVSVQLPPPLLDAVEAQVRVDGGSLEAFIHEAVAEKLVSIRRSRRSAGDTPDAIIGRALGLLSRAGGEAPRDGDALPDGWIADGTPARN